MVMVTGADGCALLGSMVGGHQDWDVDRIGKVNAEGRTIFPLDIRPRMTHDKRMKAVITHSRLRIAQMLTEDGSIRDLCPFRIIEKVDTCDGPQDLITNRSFATLEAAQLFLSAIVEDIRE